VTDPSDDLDSLACGVCPDCRSARWYLGPRGGAARNIECAGCASRFNVTLLVHEGVLVFHERIPRGGRAGPYWDARPVRLLEPDDG
jgi:hypothetical protein